MQAFADILATSGVERGLIGPREVPRLWSRHLVNCAVVAQEATDVIPEGSTVADVGSGAGLPGLVWALVRPDLTITLIEPLLRRATFLSEAVVELSLEDRVRGPSGPGGGRHATQASTSSLRARWRGSPSCSPGRSRWRASAVWCWPSRGPVQPRRWRSAEGTRAALGAGPIVIRSYGSGTIEPATTVVVIPRAR